MTDKQSARQYVRAQLQLMTAEQRLRSATISRSIEAAPAFARAKTVLVFYPLPDEPQIQYAFERWSATKLLLLPVIVGNALLVGNISKDEYHINKFGIPEPQPLPDVPQIDVALVPGVAFDDDGNRLGRGKGYYDRFLRDNNVYKIGICHNLQRLASVPHDDKDIRMDEIISI